MRQPRYGRMAGVLGVLPVGATVAVIALIMTACGPDAGPSEPAITPSYDLGWIPGTVTLCKYTEAATSQQFDFKVTATGGNVPGDGSFTLNAIQELNAGQECAVIWSAIDGSTTTITIEEVLPPGWELYLIKDDGYNIVEQTTNPYVITQYDWSDDRVIFFKNRPGEEPPPPPPPCQACQGGVTEMTLLNNGPSGEVVVKAGKKEIFRGFVASGETFTMVGQEKDGKLGKEIKIRVDDGPETKIHTSCSQPIGPGMQFGAFEVVEAFSKDGGLICPPGEVPPCDVLCEAGKPAVLTMLLTGDDCSASSHSQAADKVSCTDFGPLAGTLRVLVTDKANPADSKAKTWFDGAVTVGSAFDIAAANAGASKLSANTWVHIYDAAGTLLQLIQFHTSCSQPLALGDQFGSVQLTGFTPEG